MTGVDVEVELFKPEHMDAIEFRAQEKYEFAMDINILHRLRGMALAGTTGTMFHDGKIIAIVGYFEHWRGVYEVFAFPSVYAADYAMMYLKVCKRYMDRLAGSLPNVRRLQTPALADPLHDRWMRFLGFTNETPNGMKSYSVTGATYNYWARMFEEAA